LQTARDSLQPVIEKIAAIEAALAPYEKIKTDLSAARSRFRKLSDEFVSELKNRCAFMGDGRKRVLVLELVAEDMQGGLDAAVGEKSQGLARFLEGLGPNIGSLYAILEHHVTLLKET
jgi:type I restriction enzyme M protein